MQKTTVRPLCSIFSKDGNVCSPIKNPNDHFIQDTLKKQKYQLSLNSVQQFLRRIFLKVITSKTAKNTQKGQKLPTWVSRFSPKFDHRQISSCCIFYPRQNLVKPNGFGDICKNLLSDPYVLFSVTVAMFFSESKIPTSILCRIPQGTFITSLIPIRHIVSEEKSFEKLLTTTDNNAYGCQVMAIAHMAFDQMS